MSQITHPDWSPFRIAPAEQILAPPAPIHTDEGVADRIRSVAFAELQAREAFRWAVSRFEEESHPELIRDWSELIAEEDRHYRWLRERMAALHIDASARTVSDRLWRSLVACRTAEQFAGYVASAEERGRKAGERFEQILKDRDPETARVFGRIAAEEVRHVALAVRHFPSARSLIERGARGY